LTDERWLLVRHSPRVAPDRCSTWLSAAGIVADERLPLAGECLPDVRDYSRVVVYGGVPQVSTCGQPDWMRAELALIESALRHDVPVLGICLGAQLMSHVLGARVARHPDGLREIGFTRVEPTEAGARFMERPQLMLQWHSCGFDLPADCVHLARSRLFDCQAYRHASGSYALQFHPEVTREMLVGWQARHREAKAAWLGPVARFRHRIDCRRHDPRVTRWFDRFLHEWHGTSS